MADHQQEKRQSLYALALARAAEFSDESARVYLAVLDDCEAVDVKTACVQIAKEARQAYETAMPDAGTIRTRARQCQNRRLQPVEPRKPRHWFPASDEPRSLPQRTAEDFLRQIRERCGLAPRRKSS